MPWDNERRIIETVILFIAFFVINFLQPIDFKRLPMLEEVYDIYESNISSTIFEF